MPLASSTVATIEVELLAGPSLSVVGNVGDVNLALGMIDSAVDAIEGRVKAEALAMLHLPNSYVQANPNEKIYPLVAEGDRPTPTSPDAQVVSDSPVKAKITLSMGDIGDLKIDGGDVPPKLALKMLRHARKSVQARLGRPSLLEPHGAGLPEPKTEQNGEPKTELPPVFEGAPQTRFVT